MEKERILVLAQSLTRMKEAVNRLEEALRSEDVEHLMIAKKEILEIQQKIDGML